jgi:hypothetical protein
LGERKTGVVINQPENGFSGTLCVLLAERPPPVFPSNPLMAIQLMRFIENIDGNGFDAKMRISAQKRVECGRRTGASRAIA